jgi:hypothetical protein
LVDTAPALLLPDELAPFEPETPLEERVFTISAPSHGPS